MINSLHIENFQSHEDSIFNFHPGVNAIIGPTDNGKSASLRALRWIIFNKPSSSQYISHWNRKKSGDPKAATSATVEIDGTPVTRERSPDGNGYRIDTRFLTSVGKGVPDEITSIVNITDLNVSRQHDSPFLLCASGGEVASYLNSLIHLDTIDTAYSSADSLKHKLGKSLTEATERLEAATSKLESLTWIENAEKLVEIHTELSNRKGIIQDEIIFLSTQLNELKRIREVGKKAKVIEKAEKFIDMIEELGEKRSALLIKKTAITDLGKKLSSCHAVLAKAELTQNASRLIERIEVRKETREELMTEKKRILSYQKDLQEKRAEVVRLQKELIALEDSLPAICPLCGK